MPMDFSPVITRITIFPVKSLDGISVNQAQVTAGKCLLHDREYAILDADHRFVNGKSNPLTHLLRTQYDLDNELIFLRTGEQEHRHQFHLQKERKKLNDFLSGFFNMPVTVHQNKEGRFLDEPDISGVTLLSQASLETVGSWFDHMDLPETRRRFRTTVEISGVPAFWEDRLFGEPGQPVQFMLGEVKLSGIGPRARCTVPTRHPDDAEIIHGFPKLFSRHRSATMPEGSLLPAYGHYYYLSVDCEIPVSETGKSIRVGDTLTIPD